MAKVRREKDFWVLDYRLHGQRRRVKFTTKLEAECSLRDIERRILTERGLKPQNDEDIESAVASFLSQRKDRVTHQNEITYFEKFVSFLCDSPYRLSLVSEIREVHLQEYREERLKCVTPATVVREFGIIKVFIRKMLSLGFIDRDPLAGLSSLRVKEETRVLWSDDQIALVHETLPNFARDIFAFIALTGVRPIEATKLNWSDVNLQKGEASCHSWKNQGSGKRVIGMSDLCLKILESRLAQMKRLGIYSPHGPVFTNDQNTRITPDHLNKTYTKTRAKLGLDERLQMYSLRHSFASKLVEADVNLKVIQDLLGHSQIRTTERYLQTNVKKLREAASKIQTSLSTKYNRPA